MNKRDFAFDKVNFILLGIGVLIIILGFVLMTGSSSTETYFNPEIFSARRIKVAPIVCLAGFIFVIYAIVHKPKQEEREEIEIKEDK